MGQFSGLSQPRSLRGNFRDFLNPDRSGGTQVDFSAAVFATGKVGDWLFTGAFNSERPINQDCEGRNRLFGGIQFCEQQYPVYGDSSTFTSTTPSIDSFYARFERTSSIPGADPDYVMWGDYNTQEFARASQLYTATSRQLHGFKANYNFGPLQITGLFANNIEGFQRDTIVPNGLSGNYFLSKRLLVPGSESVFLEAEEINRPGTVIQRQQLFRGYAVEVTPDAVRGTGRNLAQAQAGTLTSNQSSHLLRIRPGIVSDCGTLIGRVFVDKNFDGEQQPNEPGVPNAVIYMDDGNRIVTDANGLFSLANVVSGYRSATLDLTRPAFSGGKR